MIHGARADNSFFGYVYLSLMVGSQAKTVSVSVNWNSQVCTKGSSLALLYNAHGFADMLSTRHILAVQNASSRMSGHPSPPLA
jgi:hypothetical protein